MRVGMPRVGSMTRLHVSDRLTGRVVEGKSDGKDCCNDEDDEGDVLQRLPDKSKKTLRGLRRYLIRAELLDTPLHLCFRTVDTYRRQITADVQTTRYNTGLHKSRPSKSDSLPKNVCVTN